MPPGPLGFVTPSERTLRQHDAHARAVARMPRFSLPPVDTGGPVKVMLSDFWHKPEVVQETGIDFDRSPFHQLTGSCFRAGVPVRMADGSEKTVEQVAVGDSVVTHRGRHRRVNDVMRRKFTGDMVTLHVRGFPFPLEMTEDHQVAVMPGRCGWRWQPGELEWKRADEIEEGDRVLIGWDRGEESRPSLDVAELLGDQALILDDLMDGRDVPVSNVGMAQWIVKRSGIDWHGKVKVVRARSEKAVNRHVPFGPSLARLVGLYLAEGGCDEGKVVFTFSADEESLCGEVLALVAGLFGAEGTTFVSNERGTSRKVVFGNTTLAAVLKALVPGNVYSKRVPGLFFSASPETKAALMLGWLHGDGHFAMNNNAPRIQGTTASPGLARDMAALALACGMRSSITRRKPRNGSRVAYDVFLSGKKALAALPALATALPGYAVERNTDTNATQYGYARAVTRVERQVVECLDVYDFEVEEDHSFIAGGLVVHNCVGAGGGNALYCLICIQRCLSEGATKAFVPFWPFSYGRCRFNEGDHGQGEGAMGSSFAETIAKEGVIAATEKDLPSFQNTDGFVLTEKLEMTWSDGGSKPCTDYLDEAKPHPLGTAAEMRTPSDMKTAILNGYPGSFACNNYIGKASVQGDALLGRWDGSGGHQQWFFGYWDHPTHGPLYAIGNNWPRSTYPQDPGGLPMVTCWVKEKDVEAAFKLDAEVFAFSHLSWFPAQADKIIDWLV